MERPIGKFWCPACFCHRMFHAVSDTEEADLECEDCDYVFRKARIEKRNGVVESRSLISKSSRIKAHEDWWREYVSNMVLNGYRKENFGGDPS